MVPSAPTSKDMGMTPEDVFPLEISKLFQTKIPLRNIEASLCKQHSQLPSRHKKQESSISSPSPPVLTQLIRAAGWHISHLMNSEGDQ